MTGSRCREDSTRGTSPFVEAAGLTAAPTEVQPEDRTQAEEVGPGQYHPHIGAGEKMWNQITQNLTILNTVKGINVLEQGFTAAQLAALSQPNRSQHPQLEEVVQGLASQGIVQKAQEEEIQLVSPIFLREKENGKYRLILDLSSLNKTLLKEEKFKMETIQMGLELLEEGSYMTKLDLKDAFFSVRVNPEERKYLRFRVGNQLWEFCRMPNGYSRAPRKFTKLMKPFMAHIRQRLTKAIIFLDDIFLINKNRKLLMEQTAYAMDLLMRLGFTINLKKSCSSPSQEMEFLGYTIKSSPPSIGLPQKKKVGIIELTLTILQKNRVSLRTLAKWLGKVQAGGLAWKWERTKLRRTQMFMIRALNIKWSLSRKGARKAFNKKRRLTPKVKAELLWWKENLLLLPPVRLKENLPEISMETDASLSGYGAVCEGECLQKTWTQEEKTLKINALELIAATRALKYFTERRKNMKVVIWIDNVTAMAYINKKGGTKSAVMLHYALLFWELAQKRELQITACYINTKQNTTADYLSRISQDRRDWSLNQRVFNRITEKLGAPEVDMMATPNNRKVERFVSWRREEAAVGTDAFLQDWNKYTRVYIYPDPLMIGRVIKKLNQSTTEIILIAPMWKSQVWYPQVLEALIDFPRSLPMMTDLIQDQRSQNHPLQEKGVLNLVAWKVSGSEWKRTAFRRKLQRWWEKDGNTLPESHTNIAGTLGTTGARGNCQIPCLPL